MQRTVHNPRRWGRLARVSSYLLLLVATSCESEATTSGKQPVDGRDSGPERIQDASAEGGSAPTDVLDAGTQPEEPGPIPCDATADDADGDGFTVVQGDCDDCDKQVNPGAYDVEGNGVDEDCSGAKDDEPTGCDIDLALDAMNPKDAIKALGICRSQAENSWGALSAAWVFPDGTTGSTLEGCPIGAPPHPLSHGILPAFGDHVRPLEGRSMVAMSSGVARSGRYELGQAWEPAYGTSPTGGLMCTGSKAPPGFPRTSSSCGSNSVAPQPTVYNGMALELIIKVPTNAMALSFDFSFFATEFPEYVCRDPGQLCRARSVHRRM